MTLERAIALAAAAHEGRTDKACEPYIFHVVQVAARVAGEARVVAALHDVLEDTEVTEAELRDRFSETVVDAVVHLTKKKGESYEAFIVRIAGAEGVAGGLAREVKVADLEHNLGRMTAKTEYLRPKYEAALDRLRSRRR
jgi:hypothetical protein